MNYLMWRYLTGLHEEIKISFLMVGHTKLPPTGALGCSNNALGEQRLGI